MRYQCYMYEYVYSILVDWRSEECCTVYSTVCSGDFPGTWKDWCDDCTLMSAVSVMSVVRVLSA